MLKRPKTGASVSTMPTRLRFCFSTVQIARTNSYSTGVPRSMKGSTTRSRPHVTATDMKIWSGV